MVLGLDHPDQHPDHHPNHHPDHHPDNHPDDHPDDHPDGHSDGHSDGHPDLEHALMNFGGTSGNFKIYGWGPKVPHYAFELGTH